MYLVLLLIIYDLKIKILQNEKLLDFDYLEVKNVQSLVLTVSLGDQIVHFSSVEYNIFTIFR